MAPTRSSSRSLPPWRTALAHLPSARFRANSAWLVCPRRRQPHPRRRRPTNPDLPRLGALIGKVGAARDRGWFPGPGPERQRGLGCLIVESLAVGQAAVGVDCAGHEAVAQVRAAVDFARPSRIAMACWLRSPTTRSSSGSDAPSTGPGRLFRRSRSGRGAASSADARPCARWAPASGPVNDVGGRRDRPSRPARTRCSAAPSGWPLPGPRRSPRP